MKATFICICILLCSHRQGESQTTGTTNQVIEGGKVIVELVKALGAKKDVEKDTGCKGHHADVCIENQSGNAITVLLEHRASAEKREIVIASGGRECSLQARVGVWTYDLKITGSPLSIRKGDMLIEGCNNMVMQIK